MDTGDESLIHILTETMNKGRGLPGRRLNLGVGPGLWCSHPSCCLVCLLVTAPQGADCAGDGGVAPGEGRGEPMLTCFSVPPRRVSRRPRPAELSRMSAAERLQLLDEERARFRELLASPAYRASPLLAIGQQLARQVHLDGGGQL